MELDQALSELKNNEGLSRGILSTSEEHPIMYLDCFAGADNREYQILEALSGKALLHRDRLPGKNYVEFYITDTGIEMLKKYVIDSRKKSQD